MPVPNVQWRTPEHGQRNCPKHVEFIDKNKFGKISAFVSFNKNKFVAQIKFLNGTVWIECVLFPIVSR
jgi:hypothetical protein